MARKLTTAEIKANENVAKAEKAVQQDKKVHSNATKKVKKYKKAKNKKLTNKWQKKEKSSKRKLERDQKTLESYKSKAKKTKDNVVANENLQTISRDINEHNSVLNNGGHGAIYQSDGSSTEVIYISPTETESEDTSSNVTTYQIDEGAPVSNYARVANKTVSLAGIITGENRADAEAKFYKLRVWHSRHYELTYKGNIYYKHLLISDIQKSHKDKIDNLDVVITFTFAYQAEITTQSDKSSKTSKKKSSKSKKTVSGNRTKNYTAITIKPGDTLWGYSQKYGKSVAWLQKVNHIKGTTIYSGKKIRVK